MHEIMSFETCPGRLYFSLRIPHDTSQTAKNKRRRWLGLFGHVFGKKATGSEHVCTVSLTFAIYQTKNDSLMKNQIFVEKCILHTSIFYEIMLTIACLDGSPQFNMGTKVR
jgi:hypothetical protein